MGSHQTLDLTAPTSHASQCLELWEELSALFKLQHICHIWYMAPNEVGHMMIWKRHIRQGRKPAPYSLGQGRVGWGETLTTKRHKGVFHGGMKMFYVTLLWCYLIACHRYYGQNCFPKKAGLEKKLRSHSGSTWVGSLRAAGGKSVRGAAFPSCLSSPYRTGTGALSAPSANSCAAPGESPPLPVVFSRVKCLFWTVNVKLRPALDF